jgi:hypothetical protein
VGWFSKQQMAAIEHLLQKLLANEVPVDLTGLHDVTAHGQHVLADFRTLTSMKGALSMTAPQNPAQQGIDTDVAALQEVFNGLGTVFNDLKAQLSALPAGVDTSQLDALVTQGQNALAQFQGLDTSNPQQPPAPAP